MLSSKGVIISIDDFIKRNGKKNMDKVLKNLTIEYCSEFKNRVIKKKITIYKLIHEIIKAEDGNEKKKEYVVLPCFTGFTLVGSLLDKIDNLLDHGTIIDRSHLIFSDNYKITMNQQIVLDKFFSNDLIVDESVQYGIVNVFSDKNISEGRSGCICEMKTGEGKTFLACAIIARLGRRTIFICPNLMLIEQTIGVIRQVLPNCIVTSMSSNSTRDDLRLVDTCDILVTTHITAINGTDEWYERMNFGLTVYDEIHMYPTEEFHKVFSCNVTNCRLGLSATTGKRKDGFDDIYTQYIGPIIKASSLDGYDISDHRFKYEIIRVNYSGPPEWTKTMQVAGTASALKTIQQFIRDGYRVKMALEIIQELYNEGRYILILCETRAIVKMLTYTLRIKFQNKIEDPQGEEKKDLDLDEEEKEQMKKQKLITHLLGGGKGNGNSDTVDESKKSRIIVATYSYASVGLSNVNLDTLMFFTPRKSNMEQIIGRISRKGSDQNIVRKIVDIVDMKTFLRNQYKERHLEYQKKEDVKFAKPRTISYEDIPLEFTEI